MSYEFQASLDVLDALPGLTVTLEENGALVKLASRSGACTYITDTQRGVTTSTLPAVIERLERVRQ